MKLYTIGFTQKTARKFFETLLQNKVTALVDIRLNNKSQLAGFAKADDLAYFLEKIAGIRYVYRPECAPSAELFEGMRNKTLKWDEFERTYRDLLVARGVVQKTNFRELDGACLLCSEASPQHCHRRVLAEFFQKSHAGIEVVHL